MSLLGRIFGREKRQQHGALLPLYNRIVAKARETHWFETGQVPDSLDGRFDMVAAILTITLLRLERDKDLARESARLTEVFISDMDGQLREIGIGDMIVGKHIGRMMASLGGRLNAFRDGFSGKIDIRDVIGRNLYRGAEMDDAAVNHVQTELGNYRTYLDNIAAEQIILGKI